MNAKNVNEKWARMESGDRIKELKQIRDTYPYGHGERKNIQDQIDIEEQKANTAKG